MSLDGWWPLGTYLLVLGVAGVAVALLVLVRARTRVPLLAVSALLVLTSAIQAANAHYGYYPTLADVFGETPDEGSIAAAEAAAADGRIPATGQVVALDLPGTASGFTPRQALAYLPPAWSVTPRPRLPVILMLHGTPGGPSDWTDGGEAQVTADAWAAAHSGVAPVLVMPDINGSLTGDTECVGNVETYLTVDVPAAIRQQLGTVEPGPGWAVAGLSEGGSCAIMLALRHPDLFAAFGNFGGLAGPRVGDANDGVAETVTELFGGSQQTFAEHEPSSILGARRFPGTGGWFQVGDQDAQPLAAYQTLVPLARAAGIEVCAVTMPGQGHTFDVWSAAFRGSLPFLAGRLGLVPRTGCG